MDAVAGCRWRGAFDGRLNGWLSKTNAWPRHPVGLSFNKNQRMEALMHAKTEKAQIQLTRSSSAYWRVSFGKPPFKANGPPVLPPNRESLTARRGRPGVRRPFLVRSARYAFPYPNH